MHQCFNIHCKKYVFTQYGSEVEQGYVSKIVNSEFPEAKDYDFSNGDTYIVGDVEFRIKCFFILSVYVILLFKK